MVCKNCDLDLDDSTVCTNCGLVHTLYEYLPDYSNLSSISTTGTVISGKSKMALKNNNLVKSASHRVLDHYITDILKILGVEPDIVIYYVVDSIMSKNAFRNKSKKAIILVVTKYTLESNKRSFDIHLAIKMLGISETYVTKANKVLSTHLSMYLPEYKYLLKFT